MEGGAGSGSETPDEWGSAVASGDATKLAELVLVWSGSMPEPARSILTGCVSLLENEVPFSAPASSPQTTRDTWGSAVASGDATKLAELVLGWSSSRPERALSVLRNCVSLMEKELLLSTPASSPPPTSLGPTRTSCLNALIVSLNETCDGKIWYTSTKELQLVSLEFCVACRSYQTVHLKIDSRIPRRLLAAAAAPPPHPTRLFGTRVPRLRARRVTWNMRTAVELKTPLFALTDVDCLEFGKKFEGSLEAVAWPQRLKTIAFFYRSRFNEPIDLVKWPASLQRLVFGGSFNRPEGPLCAADSENFYALFDQPIEGVSWPDSLELLVFGPIFNQPIEKAAWPASLKQLIFDTDSRFNQPIERVVWPTSLQQLTMGEYFNQPIQRAAFPASLQQLIFAGEFNQPIEGVLWPDSLQRLEFGSGFNQSVDNVKWPASLQELAFGWVVDEGDNRMLIFSNFNQPIGRSAWPASLRRLTLGELFSQSLEGLGTWMPNLESFRLLDYSEDDAGGDSLLRGIEWPKALRELTVFKEASLDGVVIPSSVQVIRPDLERW
ncbi:unnamed protein product [Ectocarpus fasciculatus]